MGSTRAPQRIGVFGGTFDPIHVGHLVIASDVYEALCLDKINFVVAPRPPHKGDTFASDDHRIEMVCRAIEHDPRFSLDLREFSRTGPSYTVDTLQAYHAEHAEDSLFFLMGEDSLADFPTWRDPERMLTLASLAVAARPGVTLDLSELFERLPAAQGRVEMVETPEIALSSTLIRDRCARGAAIRYLVPDAVEQFIIDHRLYSQTQLADS